MKSTEWESIFYGYASDGGLTSRMHKELKEDRQRLIRTTAPGPEKEFSKPTSEDGRKHLRSNSFFHSNQGHANTYNPEVSSYSSQSGKGQQSNEQQMLGRL